MRSLRRVAGIVTAVLVAWLACEVLLRGLVPPSIYFSRWFTGPIHVADSEFGFRFRSNYDGAMRHRDGVWCVPLELDENGHRFPAMSLPDSGGVKTVAVIDDFKTIDANKTTPVFLIGGASMVFSYGLPDDQTLAAQVSKALPFAAVTQTFSRPGFSLPQDVIELSRAFEPSRAFERNRDMVIDRAIVIIFVYQNADLIGSPEALAASPFRLIDGLAVPMDSRGRPVGTKLTGTWTDVSYVAAEARFRWASLRHQPTAPLARVAAAGRSSSRLRRAIDDVTAMGVRRILVVAIPGQDGAGTSLETWADSPDLTTALPTRSLATLDLAATIDTSDWTWIADGHYDARAVRTLCRPIAAGVSSLANDIALDDF